MFLHMIGDPDISIEGAAMFEAENSANKGPLYVNDKAMNTFMIALLR